MSWRPIDFQGIVDLDRRVVEQLEQFLQEKQNRLAYQILSMIPSISSETLSLTLPSSGSLIKLTEAVEGFSKKVRILLKSDFSRENTEFKVDQVIKDINLALWEFTEVLEGCVAELFHQVHQVSIDRWHLSLSFVVHAIKDSLIHHIEDLIWAIRRLEKPLKEFCDAFDFKPQKNRLDWISFGEPYLDRHLLVNLHKTEKILKMQYEKFHQHYNEYMVLSLKVEEHLQKMKNYPILALMEVGDQNLYVDVFRLLKMIEFNRHPKKEVALNTVRSLKYLTSIDHIFRVFRNYYRDLRDAFFNSSLEWKSFDYQEENFQDVLQRLQGKVQDYQQELKELIYTMSRYRLFMLKNDPNPYVRSRWGFTEWIVGAEPPKMKKLLNMIYAAEELEGYFNQFKEALIRDPLMQQNIEYRAHQETEKLLHEMGQPLISRSMMRKYGERLLGQLKACDEAGSPHFSTIQYVEDILSKAMREDWKYHVLHEFPLFHQVYHLHEGLIEYFEDPAHAFRLERLHLLFDQIEEWAEKEDIYSHVHEIELDMNDMKTYLQDFLATIQRANRERSQDPFLDETVHKLRHQLLEYRYTFGQFFSSIMVKSEDGMQLRNQFLFVDQYFESMETILNEMKLSWEGKIK